MAKVFDLELLFLALGNRIRLRLLNLMAEREVCVCYFSEVLKMSQPMVSRHLAYLRKAGIVAARREGKWMHYRVQIPADKRAALVLSTALMTLAEDEKMRRDRAQLEKASCSPDSIVSQIGAPLPSVVPVRG